MGGEGLQLRCARGKSIRGCVFGRCEVFWAVIDACVDDFPIFFRGCCVSYFGEGVGVI